jgi:peptide/nickel transport system permease protein
VLLDPAYARQEGDCAGVQKLIIQRILQFIPVVLLSTILVFTVVRMAPGDPATAQFGPRASDARYADAIRAYRQQLGLDKPIYVQYLLWLKQVVRGNFGESIRSQIPVTELILQKLPATLELMLAGMLFGLVFGVPLGIIAAVKRGTFIDNVASVISVIGMAIPGFWLGMLLLWVLALQFKLLPASGYTPLSEDPGENLRQLIMPAITLGVYELALVTRFLRAEMVEVMNADYIRTARAKGQFERLVIARHALKNALLPLVTILALEVGYLLGGVVVVEQVFGWSGMGWLIFQAISNRDYPVIQGVVVLIAVGYTISNLLADILYGYLDPRIRYDSRSG